MCKPMQQELFILNVDINNTLNYVNPDYRRYFDIFAKHKYDVDKLRIDPPHIFL